MDFDKLFPGRFLKAGEFENADVTLTIANVVLETLEGGKKVETKGLVSFRETAKQWVLNKTNALCLRAMWGRETNAWMGKRVTLYAAPIQFEDATICIRVRGSPDISAAVVFELKLARKAPRSVTLARTGSSPAAVLDTSASVRVGDAWVRIVEASTPELEAGLSAIQKYLQGSGGAVATREAASAKQTLVEAELALRGTHAEQAGTL